MSGRTVRGDDAHAHIHIVDPMAFQIVSWLQLTDAFAACTQQRETLAKTFETLRHLKEAVELQKAFESLNILIEKHKSLRTGKV